MGHSKGERLLAAARPPSVPELPTALRVERRICFDVTRVKLREKAMELLEKVPNLWGKEVGFVWFCLVWLDGWNVIFCLERDWKAFFFFGGVVFDQRH